MLYRLRKRWNTRKLSHAIKEILNTPPLRTQPAPWCIASMVAKGDVAMYLLSLKSFYPQLGKGKVAAIIDRDMPQVSRDILSRHVPGLEFVILEDIPTGACQRGGTWERLLYVLDRSEQEYTIQLDADTLTVGNMDEVIKCVENNTPFTMSDGFELMSLPEVAKEAEATPSDYIGIATEKMFARYPDPGMCYVRGSSGFAGFSHGGFTRGGITRFHQEMEKLVGATRWREWGTEQCGSNFAIANSPGAVILPYPEYASFTRHAAREEAKFFHFIGANRFRDNYYAARGQELIAKLLPSFTPTLRARPQPPLQDMRPLTFTRVLTPQSALHYLRWRFRGKRHDVWLRLRSEPEFPGPEFQLRPPSAGNNDADAAYEIFVRRLLQVPVRIPPERVQLIVDLGANAGMSCLYWLAAYWRAEVLAFEPRPDQAAQCRSNLARNGFLSRATVHDGAAGPDDGDLVQVMDLLRGLEGKRIDILRVSMHGGEYTLLQDSTFGKHDIRAIVLEWHQSEAHPDGEAWCSERLKALGFHVYPVFNQRTRGMMWAYRKPTILVSGASEASLPDARDANAQSSAFISPNV